MLCHLSAVAQTSSLSVSFSGTGTGTVSSSPGGFTVAAVTGAIASSPGGFTCNASCSASFSSGTSVTLTASPASGSAFFGWSGACSGTGSCVTTLSPAPSVTANFNVGSPVNISGTVFDAAGNPLSGASIYWYDNLSSGSTTLYGSGSCGTTSTAGTYSCTVPNAGSVGISGSKTNYAFTTLSRNPATTETGMNLQAILLARTISGTVQDAAGTPLSGVVSYWYTSDGQYSFTCGTTGSTGVFSCKVPQGFTGTLYAYDTASPTTVVFPSLSRTNVVSDETGAIYQGVALVRTISGTVQAIGPVSGISVRWSSSPSGPPFSGSCGTTGSTGAFTCRVPQGFTGTLFASDTASPMTVVFPSLSRSNVVSDETGTIYQGTPLLRTIAGTVRDAASNPLSAISVRWSSSSGSGFSGSCGTTVANGVFSCKVPQGFTGTVYASDTASPAAFVFSSLSRSNLTSDETGAIFPGIALVRTISGTVQDMAGNPLSGYGVSWSSSFSGYCGSTASSGVFSCKVPQGFTGSITAYYGFLQGFRSAAFSNVTREALNKLPQNATEYSN